MPSGRTRSSRPKRTHARDWGIQTLAEPICSKLPFILPTSHSSGSPASWDKRSLSTERSALLNWLNWIGPMLIGLNTGAAGDQLRLPQTRMARPVRRRGQSRSIGLPRSSCGLLLRPPHAGTDFGILKWPTSAVCFGPPLGTANFYSGFERELGSGGGSWTGEPRWSYSSRFGWSMSLG